LREVWPRENSDFTPWLADPENLSLLADTLNLGALQFEGTEVQAGNFRIDILARDDNGRIVVIENQFGLTDHTHLGQIMTYLSAQKGQVTVIWIAEKFREEH
jgi:RecB family endonuclease NucS